jgi:hypothetical protein
MTVPASRHTTPQACSFRPPPARCDLVTRLARLGCICLLRVRRWDNASSAHSILASGTLTSWLRATPRCYSRAWLWQPGDPLPGVGTEGPDRREDA